jgi:hypothetical protein
MKTCICNPEICKCDIGCCPCQDEVAEPKPTPSAPAPDSLRVACEKAKNWVYAILVSDPEMKSGETERLLDDTYKVLREALMEVTNGR